MELRSASPSPRICSDLEFASATRTVTSRSARADLLSAVVSKSTEFRSLALAFSLHPLINGLAVLVRQIGSSDAQVQHSYAHASRFPVNLLAHPPSQLRAFVPHYLDEAGLTKHTTQRRDDQ